MSNRYAVGDPVRVNKVILEHCKEVHQFLGETGVVIGVDNDVGYMQVKFDDPGTQQLNLMGRNDMYGWRFGIGASWDAFDKI